MLCWRAVGGAADEECRYAGGFGSPVTYKYRGPASLRAISEMIMRNRLSLRIQKAILGVIVSHRGRRTGNFAEWRTDILKLLDDADRSAVTDGDIEAAFEEMFQRGFLEIMWMPDYKKQDKPRPYTGDKSDNDTVFHVDDFEAVITGVGREYWGTI